MSKKEKRVCGVIVSALLIIMLCACLISPKSDTSYQVVLMGDSILANKIVLDSPAIHEYVEAKTGKKVFNGAFGGSRMAFYRSEESGAIGAPSWCMANLADAICYDAWEGVLASMSYADYYMETNKQIFENYDVRLKTLKEIDFSKVEVLVIEHGTNDYNSGIDLDNPENPFDKSTFGGALRYTLKTFSETYPQLKIVLVTPFYCEIVSEDGVYKCDEKDWGGGLLEDYVLKELEIAKEYRVDVIDGYHESGINEDTIDFYLPDSLHPAKAGIELIGDIISEYLKGNGYEN